MVPSRFARLVEPGTPVSELAERFSAAGHELYLVGGSVRDTLLGRDPTEYDFTTAARPDAIKEIIAGWGDAVFTVGEAYGTVGVVRDDQSYEITTFRSDIYRDDSRKPVVTYSDDIGTDLGRRDFTVNALALRLPDMEMIDPHGGLADLHQHLLRTPLSPEISFGDDPLRMLRLYRFVSQLGFTPDEDAIRAIGEMAERLRIVSAERIKDELSKLLVGEHVGAALYGLVETGLAAEFVPEFPALALEQDPIHHHKDVLAHTIAVVEKCPPDLVTRLAALLHDVGKPATRAFGDGGVTFHHHEVVGARMARERLTALRFPGQVVEDVAQLVFLHMRPHTYKYGWTDRAVRRYVRDAGPLLDRLNQLVRCDVTTRNERRARAISRRIDELEERIAELRSQEEIDRLRPPIDGNQVMAHLGLPPGPVVGEALDMLLERRIDDGPYSEEEAFAMLDDWWAARS